MKNTTTTTRRNSARNQSAAMDETITEIPQAENPAIEDSPSISISELTDEALQESIDCHEAIHEENKKNGPCEVSPFLTELYKERDKREKSVRLAMVADQVASYDGKPLSVQLAEWKFAFDMAKNQAGKYKNKTGESELSAKEFMQALLLQATIDGIHPREDFLDHCHFIANKRDLTSEKTLVKKVESAVTEKANALRLKTIRAAIQFRDSLERINKQLEIMELEPTTQAEVDTLAKQYS